MPVICTEGPCGAVAVGGMAVSVGGTGVGGGLVAVAGTRVGANCVALGATVAVAASATGVSLVCGRRVA